MNIEQLIESIHEENARRRQAERKAQSLKWRVGRIALPAAAVAAVLLIVFLPRAGEVHATTPAPGIYCNSQCNPDDVMALIDNNINHIKEIRKP